MKSEDRYYEITPKIVLSDNFSTIRIKPLFGHCMFDKGAVYDFGYYPMERISKIGECKCQERKKIALEDGCLYIKQYFKGEQEHIIDINETVNGEIRKTIKFHIYSLKQDLFNRRPYKGDMHMHTFYSDGIESPGFVASCCRKIGYDFMAVTDHGKYFPSIEAQQKFKDLDLDMLICRGEEVHPPENFVHMINFGGNFSINEMIKNEREKYYREVKDIEKDIDSVPDADARYQCASCIWCFDKIREAGGLGIFCHPYWELYNQYYISDTVISYMYDHQPYDANELIGGYHRDEIDSNKLQVARYYEERAKGRKIPIVGVSDSHGCENSPLFGWYYTIVFSHSKNQNGIIDGIKDLYSVAVESIPGDTARVYGPFRLVKYALFLIKEVFPMHDEMCFEEGQLMMKHLKGEGMAEKILDMLKGQTDRLYESLWAK
ncbi:MAG: hypothetical protein QME45_01130 [Clostridiales bacterium]|nr:hypothetical protein [Clostridiales bacterium]